MSDEREIKRMNIKEFRQLGYLQELNRRFLHPLGLALEIAINHDGTERLGGVWDYRDDKEGIRYDLANSDAARKLEFWDKYKFVCLEWQKRQLPREEKLGFYIEPIIDIDVLESELLKTGYVFQDQDRS